MATPTSNLNPFEGLKDGRMAAEIRPTVRIKAAILGEPKVGKSWFAATAPGSKRIYDFDDRAESLAGKPDISVVTLVDTQDKPTVWKFIESELSALKYRKLKQLPIPDTFIFDSITYLMRGIRHDYFATNPKDGRPIRVGGMLMQIGTSYDWINTANRALDYLLTEYSALGNVIFVFHEKDEKDYAESKKDNPAFTGKVTVNPQFIAPILSLFNEVFRITVNGKQEYSVTCRPTDDVNANSTLLLDVKEPPDFMAMIKKHQEKLIKK